MESFQQFRYFPSQNSHIQYTQPTPTLRPSPHHPPSPPSPLPLPSVDLTPLSTPTIPPNAHSLQCSYLPLPGPLPFSRTEGCAACMRHLHMPLCVHSILEGFLRGGRVCRCGCGCCGCGWARGAGCRGWVGLAGLPGDGVPLREERGLEALLSPFSL